VTPLLSTVAALLTAANPGALAAVPGEQAVYLWWGPSSSAAHEVQRSEAGGPFRTIARVEPLGDRGRAQALLDAAKDDPVARTLRLANDYPAGLGVASELDRDLTLASPAYAELRGAAFHDRSVSAGASYRYRVLRPSTGGAAPLLGEVEVVAGRPALPPAPEPAARLEGERPALTFAGRPFTGYEVRRAEAPTGPFEPAAGGLLPAAPDARQVEWVDRAARPDGTIRYYQVTARDLLGRPGRPSLPVPLATPDRTPPEPPQGLQTQGIPGAIRLTWEAAREPDATGYHLYRTELVRAPGETAARAGERLTLTAKLLPRATLSFDDPTALPRRRYRYEVTATDRKGNESRPSPPAHASPRDETPPARVAGLRATVGEGGRVRLSWKASQEEDLWTYRVLAGAGAQGPLRLLEQVAPLPGAKEMTHEIRFDPRSQEAHRLAVSAVDRSENEGPSSEPVEIRLPDRVPPSAPILTRLVAADAAVEIAWASAGEPDLAGHHVWRQERGKTLERLTAKPLTGEARSYRDATPLPGVAYGYAVSAVDRSGNEGARSESRTTATFRSGRPQPPAGLAARPVPGTSRILLEWRPPQGARGTLVYVAAAREGAWEQVGGLLRQSRLEVARPAQGSAFYRVQAIDGSGEPSEPCAPLEVSANGKRGKP